MGMLGLLAAKESFLLKKIAFGGALEIPYYAFFITFVVLIALIALLITASVKASRKGKRERVREEAVDVRSSFTPESEEEVVRNNGNLCSDYVRVAGIVTEPEEEEPVRTKPVKNTEVEPVAEAAATEEPIEEKSEEIVSEPTTKEEEEPVKKAEEKKPVKKEAPVKAAKKETPAKPVKKEAPAKAPAKKEAPAKPVDNKITGKIEICNSDLGGYNYLLRANNGQLLYESKSYKSVSATKDAIENFIEAVKVGMFTIRKDKFKNFKFILKSPTSNNLLYIGESFSTEASCKSNVESVKRFAPNSSVVDITEKDFVAQFVRYDIPASLVKEVEKGELSAGKWSIEKTNEEAKNSTYEFLLYANNGQLLYESRDYKTLATCRDGLKTFVNTVKTGYFIIDPDKSGRFKFVLRNNSANSVTEYYGENYDTKKACANNIESVYHFALTSPIPEC